MKKIVFLWIVAAIMTAACTEKFESSGINGVYLDQSALYLVNGNKANLVATVDPVNASEVIWRSSNTEVATVSQTGEVTATGAGQAAITVTTKIGRRVASCDVFVNPIRVTGVTITPTTFGMLVHETASLTATVNPGNAGDKFVTWSTSDDKVVEIHRVTGEMKAVKDGVAIITVVTRDGLFTAECTVTVTKIPVTSITLIPNTVTLELNQKETLLATVLPEDASFPELTWKSNDEKVATVNQSGVVTSVNPGEATITVTADGVSAECKVTVLPPSSYIETVIWDKEIDFVLNEWSNATTIPNANIAVMNPGDIIKFYFSFLGEDPEFEIWRGSWGEMLVDAVAPKAGAESYEMTLTEEMIDKMRHPEWGSGAFLVQGQQMKISKITILAPVLPFYPNQLDPFNATLADNFQWGSGYSGQMQSGKLLFDPAYDGVIAVGTVFEFDMEFTASRDFEDGELYVAIIDSREEANWWTVKGATRTKEDLIIAGEKVSRKIEVTITEATSSTTCNLHFETPGEGVAGTAGSGVKGPVTLNFTKFIVNKK